MTQRPTREAIEARLKQVERIRERWSGNPGYAATLDVDIHALRLARAAAFDSGLTADEINALPDHVRKYIHHIETNTDPAGTLRENFRLREENAALRTECARLAPKVH